MTQAPDFTLWLGSFGFSEWEVPETIEESLEQAIVEHFYPGGKRTVDSMGPKRGTITWQGWLMDQFAEKRRDELESMVRAGQSVPLIYSTRIMTVIPKRVSFRFQRHYQIPYTIELEVVDDLAQPGPDDFTDLDAAVAADVARVQVLSTIIEDIILAEAVVELVAAIAVTPDPAGATLDEIGRLFEVTVAAKGTSAGLLDSLDSGLTSAGAPGLYASGVDPVAMAGSVDTLVMVGAAVPAALEATSRLGRTQKNLSGIEG